MGMSLIATLYIQALLILHSDRFRNHKVDFRAVRSVTAWAKCIINCAGTTSKVKPMQFQTARL